MVQHLRELTDVWSDPGPSQSNQVDSLVAFPCRKHIFLVDMSISGAICPSEGAVSTSDVKSHREREGRVLQQNTVASGSRMTARGLRR